MLFFAGYDVYGQSVEPALETLNDIDFGEETVSRSSSMNSLRRPASTSRTTCWHS